MPVKVCLGAVMAGGPVAAAKAVTAKAAQRGAKDTEPQHHNNFMEGPTHIRCLFMEGSDVFLFVCFLWSEDDPNMVPR